MRKWKYDIVYLVWNQPCACYVEKRTRLTSAELMTEDGVLAAVKAWALAEWGTDDAKAIGWTISQA